MSIPSSGSSTCRRASTTSSFVGTKASLATAARRAAGLRGRVEVGAGPRIAGERRAAELRHDEAHRVELDLVPARRRRAVPLEQVVASAALDEEQVSGGLRRRGHSGGLGLGERLREPCTAAFELARPELLTGRCGLRRLGTTLDVVSRPDELLDPARLLMRLALGVAEPLDRGGALTLERSGPVLVRPRGLFCFGRPAKGLVSLALDRLQAVVELGVLGGSGAEPLALGRELFGPALEAVGPRRDLVALPLQRVGALRQPVRPRCVLPGRRDDLFPRVLELTDPPAELLGARRRLVTFALDLLEPPTKTGPRLLDADQRLMLALQLTDPPPQLSGARRRLVTLPLDLLEPPPKTRTRLLDAGQRLVLALQLTDPPPELFRARRRLVAFALDLLEPTLEAGTRLPLALELRYALCQPRGMRRSFVALALQLTDPPAELLCPGRRLVALALQRTRVLHEPVHPGCQLVVLPPERRV